MLRTPSRFANSFWVNRCRLRQANKSSPFIIGKIFQWNSLVKIFLSNSRKTGCALAKSSYISRNRSFRSNRSRRRSYAGLMTFLRDRFSNTAAIVVQRIGPPCTLGLVCPAALALAALPPAPSPQPPSTAPWVPPAPRHRSPAIHLRVSAPAPNLKPRNG